MEAVNTSRSYPERFASKPELPDDLKLLLLKTCGEHGELNHRRVRGAHCPKDYLLVMMSFYKKLLDAAQVFLWQVSQHIHILNKGV